MVFPSLSLHGFDILKMVKVKNCVFLLKILKIIMKTHFLEKQIIQQPQFIDTNEKAYFYLLSVLQKSFPIIKCPERSIFLTNTPFICNIQFLDTHSIGLSSHENVMYFFVFGVINFMAELFVNAPSCVRVNISNSKLVTFLKSLQQCLKIFHSSTILKSTSCFTFIDILCLK